MSKQDKLIAIGTVVKPHGIKGEFSVESHADSLDLFAPGVKLTLRASGGRASAGRPAPRKVGRDAGARGQTSSLSGERVVTVASCRPHQGRALLTIEGVMDRDAAESLRGMEVLVDASKLPETGEDEVYLHEIVGFDAVLEDGSKVGTLEGFLDVPGQDVWIIRAPGGREILLPAHAETIVEIDTETRRIVIAPPPGLMDLY